MMTHILPMETARIRWACRRGMLELDLFLMRFLDETFETLSDEDKQRFINLLGQEDPEIFSWLMGQQIPSDPELQLIVNKIRQHGRRTI